MATVSELIKIKGSEIVSVRPDCSIYDAIKLMSESGVGSVIVIDDKGKMRGLVSERDVIRKIAQKGVFQKDQPVKQVMVKDVIFVRPEHTVENCMELMTHEKVRHIPVIKDETLVGVISIGDVVKFLLSEKDSIIRHYEKYIYEG